MAQVFLSYARGDDGRAKSLALAIERAGYSVWWDRDLEGGAEYSLEIDQALKAATVVIVLWSKESVGSAWVRDEAAAGRDSGRLVPARLDGSEPPLGFRQYQTIDLSRWNGRSESAGVKTLKRAIAAKVGRGAATASGHEDSIAQPRSRHLPMGAIFAGLIVLAVAALGYLWFARQAGAGIPTVAIIGAPDAADRAGSASMARDLAIDIGALRGTSANAFELRDANESPEEVDYVVRVSSALRGGVASADLALTSNADARVLWTGQYQQDGSAADLRPQVATRLAKLLVCLGEAKPASGTRLDDATTPLYLRGCERIDDRVGGSVDAELISLFRQVTQRAPRFAMAWANLALLELSSVQPGRPASERGIENEGRKHLERARELDPKLGIIYLIEAGLLGYDEWEQRIPLLEEGLRRDPDYAPLHSLRSIDLRQVGFLNEAVDSAIRAAELDPLSPRSQAGVVPILSAAGRTEEALAQLQKMERLWPGVPAVEDARYAFDLRYGDPARALAMVRRDPSRSASMVASTGLPNPAVELFLEARIDPTPAKIDAAAAAYIERWRKDPTTIDIPSLVTLGKIDLAYQALQNPVTLKSYASISGVFFRAPLREFRKDERFMPLAARLGLVRYWKKTGKWPDFCLEPDLPYDCKREAAKYR